MGIGAAVKRILLTFVNNSMNNSSITQKYSPPARYTLTKVIERRDRSTYNSMNNNITQKHSPTARYTPTKVIERRDRSTYITGQWANILHNYYCCPAPLKP